MEDRDPDQQDHPRAAWPMTATNGSTSCQGDVRFVLGDQDLVLAPGDVAEFDTLVPHWFGSTGDKTV